MDQNDADLQDPVATAEIPPSGVGRAATGLLLMKWGVATALVGLVLAAFVLALQGILKLLFLFPTLLMLPTALVLVLMSEILCLVSPTRWKGRRWVLALIAAQGAVGAYALVGDEAHRRMWSGIGGLLATAAMCAYLNDLTIEFRRPDVRKLLHRFEIYSTLAGCLMLAIKEWQPRGFLLGLSLGTTMLFVSRGVRAYWGALTELYVTLRAADAVAESTRHARMPALPPTAELAWEDVALDGTESSS